MRERESEKEGKMTWTYVSEEIMTWRCLEEKIFFLSASRFNLYKTKIHNHGPHIMPKKYVGRF